MKTLKVVLKCKFSTGANIISIHTLFKIKQEENGVINA